jgi:hypothetical protein
MVVALVALTAFGGYGDASGGYPLHAEREVHLWTNAVRVEPTAFSADYAQGGCSTSEFTGDELTPKAPLLYNSDLNEASRAHSDDMFSHGWFDHDSWDGTAWDVRISSYYSGWTTIAENIAYGYGTAEIAVLRGWMCSSGHRANIMSGAYAELGTGVVSTYYTQDFGNRNGLPDPALAMGLHLPENPSGSVDFYVDFSSGGAPDSVSVVLDGVDHALGLEWGEPDRGVYSGSVSSDSSCHLYFFRAVTGDGAEHRFPEDGSYGWGSCAWDDPTARWIGVQQDDGGTGPTDTDTDTDGETGPGPSGDPDAGDTGDTGAFSTSKPSTCDSLPLAPLMAWVLVVPVVARRRRPA